LFKGNYSASEPINADSRLEAELAIGVAVEEVVRKLRG
jgi:hypothetical protein